MKGHAGFILFAATALILAGVCASIPPTALFSADSGSKFWQTVAFADGEGHPRGFGYPSVGLDPELRNIPAFTAPAGDRLVSIYPVVFPILAAGTVAAGGDRLLRSVPLLAALLAACVAGRLAARLRGEPITWRAATCVLAATPLAFYSITFWEHSLAVLVVVSALGLVASRRAELRDEWWRWAALGLLFGLGGWVRTEVLFLAPLVAFPVLVDGIRAAWKATAAGCLAMLVGTAAGAIIQFATLGSWLPLHVIYHVDPSFHDLPYLESRLSAIAAFLAPQWWCGVVTAMWLITVALMLIPGVRRRGESLGLALACVGGSVGAAFVVPAVRWTQGTRPTEAFPYSAPAATWILLSALPVVLWEQDRAVIRDRRRCFVALAAGWLVAAVFAAWPVRSLEWGARLFLPAVVLLVSLMLSLPEVGGRWRRARRLAVAAAICAAVVVQGLGLVLVRHGALTHFEIAEEIHAMTGEQEPIVTDAYLVPLISGRAWGTRRYLFCTTRRGLDRLMGRFAAKGVSAWTYATVDRVARSPLAVPPELDGPGGIAWTRTDAVERRVGSRRLRLWRYRRAVGQNEASR